MKPPVLGVLLAGGLARRMGGGDKCLKVLGGRTLLARAVERARPQVDELILNATGDPARFAECGLDVIGDAVPGFAGPLAGVLAGMERAAAHMGEDVWVATFPTDAPFFPGDLVARLRDAVMAQGADLACARSAGRSHPVFALWPVRLRGALRAALVEEGVRKVGLWLARYRVAEVDFPTEPVDPFFNINTPEDLTRAEVWL